MAKPDIEKLDPNLSSPGAGDGLRWYDIRHLAIDGRGWTDTAHPFDRLPAKAEKTVPPNVWSLSHHTAGMTVRFATAAPKLAARWTLRSEGLSMHHMPATGMSGLDLYYREGSAWKWTANGIPRAKETSQTLLDGLDPAGVREYLLYLPLYNGVESVELGIPEDAVLVKPAPWPGKPICFYGTSITQGGCSNRPGTCYTAIAARRLDRPHYNFGFSGNGRMEAVMAELLAELDCAAYVLDAFPNMDPALMRERFAPFVRILRRAWPKTPIVVMENIHYTNMNLVKSRRDNIEAKAAAMHETLKILHDEGVTRLTLVPGDILLGGDLEGTVDGCHPTDLGFMRMAEAVIPFLKPLL